MRLIRRVLQIAMKPVTAPVRILVRRLRIRQLERLVRLIQQAQHLGGDDTIRQHLLKRAKWLSVKISE